jgi:hypothetical protein
LRSFSYSGTTPTGNSISATTGPRLSGWDSSVSILPFSTGEHWQDTQYGILLKESSATGEVVHIYGAQYIVDKPQSQTSALMEWLLPEARADVAPPPANPSLEVWNETLTSDDLTLTMSGVSGSKTVLDSGSGFVTVQQNTARFTSKSSITALTWDHSASGCGCFPISGTISTTFTGSKTGSEVATFDQSTCGSYTLQQTDTSGKPVGVPVTGTLSYCM